MRPGARLASGVWTLNLGRRDNYEQQIPFGSAQGRLSTSFGMTHYRVMAFSRAEARRFHRALIRLGSAY